MKVLVCGGRDYADWQRVLGVLDRLHAERGITCVIHGAASGADLLAERWAKAAQVPYRGYPAQWRRFGQGAGPRRNCLMLAEHVNCPAKVGLVVAFPGGTGTAHMVRLAKAAGIEVLEVGRG